VEGSCEHGNEPSGSINSWEVLEQLHNWRLLKSSVSFEYPSIFKTDVRVKFTIVITQFWITVANELSSVNTLHDRKLCSRSRTDEQSFIQCYIDAMSKILC
jgi:hypothetical protein